MIPSGATPFYEYYSSTYVALDGNETLSPYAASVSGHLATDTVSLTVSDYQLTSTEFTFVLVTKETEQLYSVVDGMLVTAMQGLGLSGHFPSLFQAFQTSGQVASPLFSLYLSDNGYTMESTSPSSALLLGHSDLRTYSTASSFTYVPMPYPSLWGVQVTKFRVGKAVLPLSQSRFVSIDIGVDVIFVYENDYQWIVTAVQGDRDCGISSASGLLVCDCTTNYAVDDYPVLYITLGNVELSLKPEQYFYPVSIT